MGILDDTAIFAAVVTEGGFSHAAKFLGISNGLVSRRIAQLEQKLGVTLLLRSTRNLHLTAEGELFWQHAKRIQHELAHAITDIQTLATKPSGAIKMSAPVSFGRNYLAPILSKFLLQFTDIKLDLMLTNQHLDPINDQIDLLIRGTGYLEKAMLKDSNLRTKLLLKQSFGIFASPQYLDAYGEPQTPDNLYSHRILGYAEKINMPKHIVWNYRYKGKAMSVGLKPSFACNDIDALLSAALAGYGVLRAPERTVRSAIENKQLIPLLSTYDWGDFLIFAIYSQQKNLPKRTRLLLDFISTHLKI